MSGAARAVLSPPLVILQPHVFNFLRLSFNRCPLWENFTGRFEFELKFKFEFDSSGVVVQPI